MATKKISIVVPVKNGIETLERFIKGVQLQTCFKDTEVVIIDSGSTDGSVAYLSQFDFVKLIAIDPKTFNHGSTRNLAVTYCKGEFVLMTVQDAWTTDPLLIERMLSHFKDIEVMGVCGHQIVPHMKGMNPHKWFRPQNEPLPKAIQFKNGAFHHLSPKEQFGYCGWDNVIAMYRKSALIAMPFITTDFAEDLIWAKQALSAQHKLVYDHRNRVNHYHHAYPDYVYKRIFIESYAIYKHFNYERHVKVPIAIYVKMLFRNIKWGLSPYWMVFNFRALRAQDKADDLFHKALNKGETYLDKTYKAVCGSIPQGQMPTKTDT